MARRHRDAKIDGELRFHVEQATADYVAAGVAPEEARRRALAEFGSMASAAEQCREVGGAGWFDRLLQDVRYGWRVLRNDRGYAAAAIAALGLGLGANIAVFTLFDAVALRPLGVPAPAEVTSLYRNTPEFPGGPFSYADYVFIRDHATAFRGTAALFAAHLRMSGSTEGPPIATDFAGIRAPRTIGDAQPVLGVFVSGNYFDVMQVRPVRGRTLTADDDRQTGPPYAALLSEDFWRRRFGADPSILGRALTFSAISTVIVGITPAGYHGTRPQVPDVWLPLGAQTPLARRAADAQSLCCWPEARLAPGRTAAEARAEIAALAPHLPSFTLSDVHPVVSVEPAVPFGRNHRAFQILFSAILQPTIALVLLIACANAAGLALGRAAARRREIAMRLALGASRGRIVRQLLTEGVLVAMIAAALAVVAARWIVGAFATAAFSWLANSGFSDGGTVLLDLALRPSILVYALALAVIAGMAFAVPAALQATDREVATALADRSSASAPAGARLRGWMVGVQLAVCLMLLIAASSLVSSSLRVLQFDLGVAARNVVDLTIVDPHEFGRSDAAAVAARDEIASRLRTLPNVLGVAFASRIPLGGGGAMATARSMTTDVRLEDSATALAPVTFVSPEYFATIGMRVVEGRTFTAAEARPDAGAVVISQALARRLWPGLDPIGRRVAIGSPGRARFQFARDAYLASATVVGVAADVRSISALTVDAAAIYLPERGTQWPAHMLVRTDGPAERAAPAISAAVAHAHPELPGGFQPLDEALRGSAEFVLARLGAMLFAVIGVLGLGLACLGVYSLVGYSVAQQVRELAIRIALGASRRDVLRLMMVRSAGPLAGGLGAGVLLGVGAARVLAAFVPSTGLLGAAAIVAATLTLAGVAAVAALIPARRAATLDPAVILRAE